MRRLVQVVSDVRAKHGEVPLDPDLSLIRLKSIDLRNESRFLDKGKLKIDLAISYLRAAILRHEH